MLDRHGCCQALRLSSQVQTGFSILNITHSSSHVCLGTCCASCRLLPPMMCQRSHVPVVRESSCSRDGIRQSLRWWHRSASQGGHQRGSRKQARQRQRRWQERRQSASGAGRQSRGRRRQHQSTQPQQAQQWMCRSASAAGPQSIHRQRPPHRQLRSGPKRSVAGRQSCSRRRPQVRLMGLLLLRWPSKVDWQS